MGIAAEDLPAARGGFEATALDAGILLPKELFDSASENLLQNALEKRKVDPTSR